VHIAIRKETDTQSHLDLAIISNDFEGRVGTLEWAIHNKVKKDEDGFEDKTPEKAAFFIEWLAAPGAIAETQIKHCLSKLVPGRKYTKKSLKSIWKCSEETLENLLEKLETEGLMVSMGAGGYVVEGGNYDNYKKIMESAYQE